MTDGTTPGITLFSVCIAALLVVAAAGCTSPSSAPPPTFSSTPTVAALPTAGISSTPASTSARGAHTIVCIGDSLTRKWPTLLEQRLGAGWTVLTKRGDADTTDQMLARFDADVIAYHPAYVVILAGTAHLEPGIGPEAVEPGIAKMCALARSHGITPVMCTIPPDNEAGVTIQEVNDLNAWITSYAKSHGYHVIDFYSLLNDPHKPGHMLSKYASGDGIHPNDAGYRAMAAYVPLQFFASVTSRA